MRSAICTLHIPSIASFLVASFFVASFFVASFFIPIQLYYSSMPVAAVVVEWFAVPCAVVF